MKKLGDIHSDFAIAANEIMPQMDEARDLYRQIAKSKNVGKITIVGHSIGGAMAQIIGAETGEETVTFNAPGVNHLLKNSQKKPHEYKNITNYNLGNEILNILNIAGGLELLGNSYILPSNGHNPIDAHCDFDTLKDMQKEAIPYTNWYYKNRELCSMLKRLSKTSFRGKITDISKSMYDILGRYLSRRDVPAQKNKFFNQEFNLKHFENPIKTKPQSETKCNEKAKRYNEEDGYWFTTKNGKHVFVEDK